MKVLLLLALFLSPTASFAQVADSNRDRLLEIHAEVIRAHIERNVDLWMSLEAEGYTSVNNGTVSFPSLGERRAQRAVYLDSTTFEIYRDVREPIVRISEDGSLGWLVAEVEVSGSSPGPDNESASFHVFWAWIEMYEKDNGEWRIVGNVSNRR